MTGLFESSRPFTDETIRQIRTAWAIRPPELAFSIPWPGVSFAIIEAARNRFVGDLPAFQHAYQPLVYRQPLPSEIH